MDIRLATVLVWSWRSWACLAHCECTDRWGAEKDELRFCLLWSSSRGSHADGRHNRLTHTLLTGDWTVFTGTRFPAPELLNLPVRISSTSKFCVGVGGGAGQDGGAVHGERRATDGWMQSGSTSGSDCHWRERCSGSNLVRERERPLGDRVLSALHWFILCPKGAPASLPASVSPSVKQDATFPKVAKV